MILYPFSDETQKREGPEDEDRASLRNVILKLLYF
jgi:hypothetical protein